MRINPDGTGRSRLTVRSIDVAGNMSGDVAYETLIPASWPRVTVTPDLPALDDEVTLTLVPRAGITGVTGWEITTNGATRTLDAGQDGTASFTFVASDPDGYQITVRSHSANGFVSQPITTQVIPLW